MSHERKTMKIDMHVHTKGSDGWGSAEEIAEYAVERGLDGVCITDHHKTFTKAGDEVARECAAAGIRVFRGCEYSTKDGHCLIYGLDVELLGLGKYPSMQEVIDKVNAAGGAAVPAHPYHGYKFRLGDKVMELKGIAGVEVRNGQNAVRSPWENDEAVRVAREMGISGIGGSDAHDPKYVGVCFSQFDGWIHSDKELAAALREGRKVKAVRNRRAVKAIKRVRAVFLEKQRRIMVDRKWAKDVDRGMAFGMGQEGLESDLDNFQNVSDPKQDEPSDYSDPFYSEAFPGREGGDN